MAVIFTESAIQRMGYQVIGFPNSFMIKQACELNSCFFVMYKYFDLAENVLYYTDDEYDVACCKNKQEMVYCIECLNEAQKRNKKDLKSLFVPFNCIIPFDCKEDAIDFVKGIGPYCMGCGTGFISKIISYQDLCKFM